MEKTADLPSAYSEVLGHLQGGHWQLLLEDPGADLPFSTFDPLEGFFDLPKAWFKMIVCFLLECRTRQDVMRHVNRLDTSGHFEAVGFEDDAKERRQLLRGVFLPRHDQCLCSRHDGLLEQVVLICCHVWEIGVRDPVDNVHVEADPFHGGEPDFMVGG